jgi:limonene-1,2-epoxide hydrolase
MNSPKEILVTWVERFTNADVESLMNLYAEDAVNHQVANEPVEGKAAIKEMFAKEFAQAEMTCILENMFEDGEWAIMEWKDPLGLRGCGFFKIVKEKIVFQRGYWDKLSFLKMNNLPLE